MLIRSIFLGMVALTMSATVVTAEAVDQCQSDPEINCRVIGTDWQDQTVRGLEEILTPKVDHYFRVSGIFPVVYFVMEGEMTDCFVLVRQFPFPDDIEVPIGEDGLMYIEDLDGALVPADEIQVNLDTCRSPIEEEISNRLGF